MKSATCCKADMRGFTCGTSAKTVDSTTFRPMLFNASERPSDERIDHVVTTAVRTFLAAMCP
jgi:hypothetical protein